MFDCSLEAVYGVTCLQVSNNSVPVSHGFGTQLESDACLYVSPVSGVPEVGDDCEAALRATLAAECEQGIASRQRAIGMARVLSLQL